MTHFVLLIIIPRSIFIQGNSAINEYINNTMNQYSENTLIEPYIVLTKEQLQQEFNKFNKKYSADTFANIIEYAHDNGYELDNNGNALSTSNTNSCYDWFNVGARWDGQILSRTTPQSSDGCFNFGNKHYTIENNSCSIKDFITQYESNKEKISYDHIIDKHGKLHKQVTVGWFGSFDKQMDDAEWENVYEQVLHDSYDDYIVNLDCYNF